MMQSNKVKGQTRKQAAVRKQMRIDRYNQKTRRRLVREGSAKHIIAELREATRLR